MAKAVTSKTESLTVRVPVDLMADLRSEAKETGASVGSVMVGKARSTSMPSDLGPVVYFLRAGPDGPVKIGWSTKLSSRIGAIQTGSPVKLNLIRTVARESWCEGWFHDQFGEQRLEGEWFEFDERMLTMEPPESPPPVEPTLRQYSGKLRLRSFKVPDEMWRRWHVQAKAAGISLTALVIQRMEGQAPGADAAAPEVIAAKDAVIADLRETLAEVDQRAAMSAETIDQMQAVIDAAKQDIERLTKELAAAKAKPVNPVVQALRADPAMKVVELDPTSEKLVAKVLPVTGTQFERQPTWWEKKQREGGKGKGRR